MTMASLRANSSQDSGQEPCQVVMLTMASGVGLVAGAILSAAQ
jgi:hypothetical protein